jgi:hypothetical protein
MNRSLTLFTILCCSAIFSTTATNLSHPFDKCQTDGTLNATNLVLNPDPPQKGKELTVAIIGTTEGDTYTQLDSFDFKVKYKGIELYSEDRNICGCVKGGCPIESPYVEIDYSNTLPHYIMSGLYELKVIVANNIGNNVACIYANATIK